MLCLKSVQTLHFCTLMVYVKVGYSLIHVKNWLQTVREDSAAECQIRAQKSCSNLEISYRFRALRTLMLKVQNYGKNSTSALDLSFYGQLCLIVVLGYLCTQNASRRTKFSRKRDHYFKLGACHLYAFRNGTSSIHKIL